MYFPYQAHSSILVLNYMTHRKDCLSLTGLKSSCGLVTCTRMTSKSWCEVKLYDTSQKKFFLNVS